MKKTTTICAAVVKSTIESLVGAGVDLKEIEAMLGIRLEQLADPREYAISEIAFLPGFSEHSSFYRAFRRWYCQNPGEYQTKMKG